MDATQAGLPWPGYVEKAEAAMDDPKILPHFFAHKVIPGHPEFAEQKAMAESLIEFIEQKINW